MCTIISYKHEFIFGFGSTMLVGFLRSCNISPSLCIRNSCFRFGQHGHWLPYTYRKHRFTLVTFLVQRFPTWDRLSERWIRRIVIFQLPQKRTKSIDICDVELTRDKNYFSLKMLNFNAGFTGYWTCLQSLKNSLSGGLRYSPFVGTTDP